MALTLDEINHKLREAKPELLKRLELDVVLEAELERTDVITDALADTLKIPTQSPKQRTDLLIDSVRQGPVKRFLDLCKVLHEQGRPHILEYLDVDIKEIETQLALIALEQNALRFAGPSANVPGKLFQHQKKYYQQVLCKIPIYEYIMRSSFVNIEEVFTTLEIVDNENDRDMRRPMNKRSQAKPISLHGIFKGSADSSLRILLEGNPGMGKSSILKHVAVRWATDNTHTKKTEIGPEGATSSDHPDYSASSLVHVDLLIFVDKSHEGKDLNSTIRNALKGSPAEQEKAFRFYQEHPEKCFLFLDGLDEFVNKEFLKEFYSFLSKCYMNILVSCRTGHPYLENQLRSFNRHIKVSGFDTENSKEFVKRFLNSLNPDDAGAVDEKIAHLCTFLASESVQTFYHNPLNCAFVCLLYYDDDITQEELSQLTLTDLFRKQQEQLLKRECLKRSDSQVEADELKKTVQASVEGVYRLALHSLLDEKGQTSYSEEDLKAFGIDLKSPAIVLLHEESDILGKSYSWPHQIIKEFHAAGAVRNETIMYMIASKPELNQISKFLFSVLIDTDREAARNLLTALLTMQSQDPACATKPPKGSFSTSTFGHPCTQVAVLRKFLSQQNIDQLLHTPPAHFPLSEKFLRLADIQQCLSNTPWALQNYLVIKRLIDLVMEVSSKDEHYELLRSVIHPYLPSSFSGSMHSWYRLCPWDAPDDWEDATLDKLLAARTKFDHELHPVRGRCPLMELLFVEAGGLYYLACKLGLSDSRKSTTNVFILVHTVDDVIDTVEHSTVLHRFAKKHHKPDVVQLYTRYDNWLWPGVPCGEDKADSGKWKEAIILLNDMFKPRKGVDTVPSYDKLLTVEDQQELEQRKITLLE